MSGTRKRRMTAGITLIAVGLVLYLLLRLDRLEGEAFLLVAGAAFLAVYFARRTYGFLIPGAILTGLGCGRLLEESLATRVDWTELGLGLGFVAIYLVALLYERRSHWWPLIPGGLLVLAAIPDTEDIVGYLMDNWPLILVAVGVLILVLGLADRKRAA